MVWLLTQEGLTDTRCKQCELDSEDPHVHRGAINHVPGTERMSLNWWKNSQSRSGTVEETGGSGSSGTTEIGQREWTCSCGGWVPRGSDITWEEHREKLGDYGCLRLSSPPTQTTQSTPLDVPPESVISYKEFAGAGRMIVVRSPISPSRARELLNWKGRLIESSPGGSPVTFRGWGSGNHNFLLQQSNGAPTTCESSSDNSMMGGSWASFSMPEEFTTQTPLTSSGTSVQTTLGSTLPDVEGNEYSEDQTYLDDGVTVPERCEDCPTWPDFLVNDGARVLSSPRPLCHGHAKAKGWGHEMKWNTNSHRFLFVCDSCFQPARWAWGQKSEDWGEIEYFCYDCNEKEKGEIPNSTQGWDLGVITNG